jgi:Aminopeptidase N
LQQSAKQPLHIPLSIALYDTEGSPLPLIAKGEPTSSVLEVTLAEQTFVFDVAKQAQKPIVALLQDFSAPVKLDYPYTAAELALLMRCAENDFIRWDAGQMLLNQFVIDGVGRFKNAEPFAEPESIIRALRIVLQDQHLDPALVAEMVALPSESSMAELFAAVNIEAIHAIREYLLDTIANVLHVEWLDIYHRLRVTGPYQNIPAQAKNRALVNQALGYLARAGGDEVSNLVRAHYEQADNMTDTLAAMQAANGGRLPLLDDLLADFEGKWHQDGLVMDNWLRIQAQGSIDRVFVQLEQAMQHPVFSLKNPNRVRALIGTFSTANPFAFHQADGRGYRLLCRVIAELNQINPQVAARLITPLIQFKKLDQGRRSLIRHELEGLAALPELSRDLSEKIGRALSQ